jgi:hypothetical protein
VTGQFRPDGAPAHTGTQRNILSSTFQVLYSMSPDRSAPLVTDVHVAFAGGTATVSARVTDDAGVTAAAALVNDGSWHYLQLAPSSGDPTLWQGTLATVTEPEVVVEASDGVNVGFSANKGSNFTSASTAGAGAGAAILIHDPTGPYAPSQVVPASYSCPGAVSCVGTVPTGTPIDTASFGSHVFTVTATQSDGSVESLHRNYVVRYPFAGFFRPVDNQPVLNVAKAGSAVPIKFSLGGNQGLNVLAPGYPSSETIACDSSAPADGIDQTVTAGSSNLSYDAASDTYMYVWKTESSWVGSCRALVVKTKDGVAHRADFKFK